MNDSVMALPAGGTVTVQLAGNVAFTKLGPSVSSGAEWPGGIIEYLILFSSYSLSYTNHRRASWYKE